jgi:Holliday junction resolvase RusA-like endonuclease
VEYLHDNGWYWFVLDLNPEPWAIGPLSVGRAKGGKVFPSVGRNTQLYHYQMAVKEALGTPDIFFESKVELRFFFWRRRDEYNTPQARTHRKHEADLTNLQKATEDALQGVLFKNDKDVNDVHSVMVKQGPDVDSYVVIAIRKGQINPVAQLPHDVIALMDELEDEFDNSWEGPQ